MKYLTIALSFAAVAYAQLPAVPSCSLNCFVTALTGDGCSGLTDFKCHCSKPGLSAQIVPCVKKNCPSEADQQSVIQVVSSQCNSAGVPITVSLDASESATSSSGAGVKTSSAAASVAPTSTGGVSSPLTFSVSGAGSTGSSAAATTAAGEGSSVAAAGSSSPAQFTGAADHNVANGAAFGLGIAALVAAL
ncbi:CFEM-domain-containing protein [Rhizodiscina lignyota]|uniref:CFEM-domain-containing protein n=1 Tax=Rhizodiscina lignyota TaxID=1504668 RepID=A0A9P4I7K0_9PEZI|nr:CFEM-domain-containing protein [Rhizodiscina lignyota]